LLKAIQDCCNELPNRDDKLHRAIFPVTYFKTGSWSSLHYGMPMEVIATLSQRHIMARQ